MKALFILSLLCAVVAMAETNQPPTRPGLKINAEFGRFNLKESVVYYSNNVVVVDPPSKPGDPPTIVRCREASAKMGEKGRIETITAVGAVQIDQGDRHARSDRAVYYATNETMVLTGGFDAQNPRPYLFSTEGRSDGDVIVYDRIAGTISFQEVKTEIHGSALKSMNKTNATNSVRAPAPKPAAPANP